MNSLALNLSNTLIHQDGNGLYCLNDLHKAAGGEKRHQPSNWFQLDPTKELVAVLETENETPGYPGVYEIENNQIIRTTEGRNGGTFVCKELVYAYATWVSPQFFLYVIRTFDALMTRQLRETEEQMAFCRMHWRNIAYRHIERFHNAINNSQLYDQQKDAEIKRLKDVVMQMAKMLQR